MNKNKFNFFVKIFVVISCIFAVFACGYFSLDKIIIPRNFSNYGICSVKDLTNVFASLYGVPKESKIVKNGFEEKDLIGAVKKLQDVGYKIEDDGTILKENISTFGKDVNELTISVPKSSIINKSQSKILSAKSFPSLLSLLNNQSAKSSPSVSASSASFNRSVDNVTSL